MKSTIATILGTAALGLMKKQMGSSTRLTKKTGYEYMMYFILLQDGYNWETDTSAMESMKEVLWDMQLLDEKPIEFVNELYSTFFDPFIIYTPCAKYTAQLKKRSIRPERNETMEKLAYLAMALGEVPEVWFQKEKEHSTSTIYHEKTTRHCGRKRKPACNVVFSLGKSIRQSRRNRTGEGNKKAQHP